MQFFFYLFGMSAVNFHTCFQHWFVNCFGGTETIRAIIKAGPSKGFQFSVHLDVSMKVQASLFHFCATDYSTITQPLRMIDMVYVVKLATIYDFQKQNALLSSNVQQFCYPRKLIYSLFPPNVMIITLFSILRVL